MLTGFWAIGGFTVNWTGAPNGSAAPRIGRKADGVVVVNVSQGSRLLPNGPTLKSSSKPDSACEMLPLCGEQFESELKLSTLTQSLFDFWVSVGLLGGELKSINW